MNGIQRRAKGWAAAIRAAMDGLGLNVAVLGYMYQVSTPARAWMDHGWIMEGWTLAICP